MYLLFSRISTIRLISFEKIDKIYIYFALGGERFDLNIVLEGMLQKNVAATCLATLQGTNNKSLPSSFLLLQSFAGDSMLSDVARTLQQQRRRFSRLSYRVLAMAGREIHKGASTFPVACWPAVCSSGEIFRDGRRQPECALETCQRLPRIATVEMISLSRGQKKSG